MIGTIFSLDQDISDRFISNSTSYCKINKWFIKSVRNLLSNADEAPVDYERVFRINEKLGKMSFYGMITAQKYNIELSASNGKANATETIMLLMEYYPPPLPPTNFPPMFIRPV